jgi:hypothetical protein
MLMRWAACIAAAGLSLLSYEGNRPPPARELSGTLPDSVHASRMSISIAESVPLKKVYLEDTCCSILIVKPDPDRVYPVLRVCLRRNKEPRCDGWKACSLQRLEPSQ